MSSIALILALTFSLLIGKLNFLCVFLPALGWTTPGANMSPLALPASWAVPLCSATTSTWFKPWVLLKKLASLVSF